MPKTNVYVASGFRLLDQLDAGGMLLYPVAAGITIANGDALHDNGAGFATNATVQFASTFLGFAAAAKDNASGIAGAVDVSIIPPLKQYRFIVPVANALITAAARGTFVDLEAAGTIDLSDTVTTGPAFKIEEIDVTTDAVAANAYGYAIGRFVEAISAVT